MKAATPRKVAEAIARYQTDDGVIAAAMAILERRFERTRMQVSGPQSANQYLCLRHGDLQHEVFTVLFLDGQHRLIAADDMFRGTLTQTSVYPREIVKAALAHNAAAVIFSHNHPSGEPQPSRADELLTTALKAALDLVDIKVLDHIIAAGSRSWSFAEKGMI